MVAWRLVALQKQRVTVLTTTARLINTEQLPDDRLRLRGEEPESPSHKKPHIRVKTPSSKTQSGQTVSSPGSHLHDCAG